jgi:MFS family permease
VELTASSGQRQLGGLLRQRNFRLLWSGETVSWLGSSMAVVGMPLLAVTLLHASNFAVGALVAAAWLPWLLIGLPAGAWVDRLPGRPVMITCDVVSAVLYLSIPVSAWAGVLTLAQVMVVAFLAGTANVFFSTAYQVYLPALVTPAELLEGNSKLTASQSAAELAGPGAAGLVAQAVGVVTALLGNAVSFLVSAACLLGTRPRTTGPSSPAEPRRLRQTIADGIRFVAGDPYLSRMCLSATLSNLGLSGFEAVQIVFLVRVLKFDPFAVGLLVAAPGAGALLGSLAASRVAERIGTARSLLLAFCGAQPFCLLAPLATRGPGLSLYVAGVMIVSISTGVSNVISGSFRQAYTPPGMLGRVSASMRFLVYGGIPLGALASGALAATLGPRQALWIIFAVLTASGAPLLSRRFIRSRDLPAAPGPAASAGGYGARTRRRPAGKHRKPPRLARILRTGASGPGAVQRGQGRANTPG